MDINNNLFSPSKEDLLLIFENIPIPAYIWKKFGKNWILVQSNESARRITDNQICNYIGINLLDFYKNKNDILEDFHNCVKSGETVRREMEYRYRSTGKAKNLEVIYRFINPNLVLVLTIDITENKKNERRIENSVKKLIRSEARFKAIFENLPFQAFVIDNTGTYRMQNSIIEEDFGDIIGQKPEDIASNEETLKLWKDNNRRAFSGETVKGEVSFPIKGKMKYFYNIITPIWEEKRIDGILGVNIDITELKIIEKKLKRSEGNYRETYNRAEFYKDIFAHDINNILQNILSAVELFEIFLRKGRNFSEIERLMKLIKNQINRGSKLVRNIKNLSGTITDARLVPVNFYGLLQGIIEEITQEFKNRELKIDINIQNKSLEVKANHLLKDVFENIIQNAIAYNNNKIINLQVNIFRKESEGIDYIQFEFIDNGIGIEEERKRLIFHRIDNAANNIEGIGLGLSMIKKIIECYRGSIWVENKIIDDYTKGSKFVFLIPEAKK